jgi:hypothetical protein
MRSHFIFLQVLVCFLMTTTLSAEPPLPPMSCAEMTLLLGEGWAKEPLKVPLPSQLLARPTRLQALLEKTHFNQLKSSEHDPVVARLFNESKQSKIHWRELAQETESAASYAAYFSVPDLIFMAADKKYAKKIASDLRTYANMQMAGHTSIFTNDAIYMTARLLVDRMRISNAGFREITTLKEFKEQAQKAGVRVQKKNLLYLVSDRDPKALLSGDVIAKSKNALQEESLLEAYADLRRVKDSRTSNFFGLRDQPGYLWEGPKAESLQAGKQAVVKYLEKYDNEADLAEKDFSAAAIKHAAGYHGQSLSKFVKVLESSSGYEYEVQDLSVVKPGTLNQLWTAFEIPTRQVRRYRQFFAVRAEYLEAHSHRPDKRDAYLFIPSEWVEFQK